MAEQATPVQGVPVVSVILVSDYASGEEASWEEARETLRGLAAQDLNVPVEYLLIEREGMVVPHDLDRLLPGLCLMRSSRNTSYAMKNEAVRAAHADLVGLLDLDCIPDPGWLRALVTAMQQHPSAVVISGRTIHGGHNLTEKILGLVARAYLDPGGPGKIRHLANHNAVYRRATYLSHPLPEDTPPFTSSLQAEAIVRDGGELRFEPAMLVVHEYAGWAAQRDISVNAGYCTIVCRLRDPRVPYASLTRLGIASIPLFVGGKIIDAWLACLRCGPAYDIPWYAQPYAFALAVVTRLMEAPGMWRAFRGETLATTEYR